MISACFERQWAGLSQYEREWIETQTACDPGYMPMSYPGGLPQPRQAILWYVERDNRSVAPGDCLISIKVD